MESVWTHSVKGLEKPRETLRGVKKTEALIIGGGLAGILTAHRLREAGVPSLVLEAKKIGGGITGNTTGKITAQQGLIYAKLLRRCGSQKARLYYDANTWAQGAYDDLAEVHPCDLEEKTAWVYSVESRSVLEEEAKACDKLDIPVGFSESLPLPLETCGGLSMEGQRQFNPLKLLYALSQGLKVYEDSFVERIEGDTAYTKEGSVTAKHIILATHYPMVNVPGFYFMKLYQHRSYVLALEGAPLLDGMYLDEREDGHSFRSYENLLLVGGGDHRTGKPGGGFTELRGLAQKAYPQATERFHWATQDCMSLDGLPYVGRHSSGRSRLYVASGFHKWGMSGSMVAARILCDLVTEGRSDLEALYSPRRPMAVGQLLANLGAATVGLLSPGGPRCAHMGCKLHWNSTEGTWDCACHGSRFSKGGELIDNPAKRGIRS